MIDHHRTHYLCILQRLRNKTELEKRRVHIYALTLGIPGEMRIFPPLFVPSSLSLTAAGQEMAVFRRQDLSALHFHSNDHNWSVSASTSPGSATERREQVSTELACQGGGQLEMCGCDFPRNHLSSHRQTYHILVTIATGPSVVRKSISLPEDRLPLERTLLAQLADRFESIAKPVPYSHHHGEQEDQSLPRHPEKGRPVGKWQP